jgi:hypothetical protein
VAVVVGGAGSSLALASSSDGVRSTANTPVNADTPVTSSTTTASHDEFAECLADRGVPVFEVNAEDAPSGSGTTNSGGIGSLVGEGGTTEAGTPEAGTAEAGTAEAVQSPEHLAALEACREFLPAPGEGGPPVVCWSETDPANPPAGGTGAGHGIGSGDGAPARGSGGPDGDGAEAGQPATGGQPLQCPDGGEVTGEPGRVIGGQVAPPALAPAA